MSGRRPAGETRALVAELFERGLTAGEIARELGVSKPTVSYHARRLGIPSSSKFARRYDWAAVQRFHDEGHGLAECRLRFGCSRKTLANAVGRGELVVRE